MELLIKAFSNETIKVKNIKLYVAGECYENPKKYIKLIDYYSLKNKVILDFKFKRRDDIQKLFSATDMIAQTYHNASQSGVTPMAYHYQKPILVSNIEGLKEPIERDGSGIVVNKNPLEISRGIIKLLEKKIYNQYLDNIKLKTSGYDWDNFVKEWHHFISKNHLKSQ